MHAGFISGNQTGRLYGVILPISALVLLSIFLAGSIRRRLEAKKGWIHCLAGGFPLFIALGCLLAASGCGYNANTAGNGTQRGMATVMVTGGSGSLSHSTSVALTVQ